MAQEVEAATAEPTPEAEQVVDEVAEQTPPAEVAPAAEGQSTDEPAEGSDEVAPPTEDSPQPAEVAAEGQSTEEPAEGAPEDTQA